MYIIQKPNFIFILSYSPLPLPTSTLVLGAIINHHKDVFFNKLHLLIYLCYINLFIWVVWVLGGGGTWDECSMVHVWRPEEIYQNQPFVSTMWVLGIELKLSCLTFYFFHSLFKNLMLEYRNSTSFFLHFIFCLLNDVNWLRIAKIFCSFLRCQVNSHILGSENRGHSFLAPGHKHV